MIRLTKISVVCVLRLLPSIGRAQVISLSEGEYRLGDSPQTPEAGLAWLTAELNSPEWRPFRLEDGHPSQGFNHVWRRFILPDQSVDAANLLIRDAPAFEIYLDGRLIDKIGQLHQSADNKGLSTSTPHLIILSLSLVVSALATARYLGRPQSSPDNAQDRNLLLVGYGVLTIAAAHDLLGGFRLIPLIIPLFHFGVLGFVIFLAVILERRFARAHEHLEEANRTLEQRVEERTTDLATKNFDLELAMSDLRDAQQQLIIREKMASLGDLVAGVAHEVNTPIGAVNSSADVTNRCIEKIEGVINQSAAADELKTSQPYQQAIQILKDNAGLIRSAGERIATIVRSLRSFARLDEAEYQSADIHIGLDSTLDLVNHELRNRVEVVKEYGDLPMVDCFPNKLNQVFMNLLINASQAIEGSGTILLSTELAGDTVVIRIADSGKGISPENLGKVFNPGFTTKGVGVGTGLGLAISYTIIGDHRGSITAKSELGRGTTFTIRLPIKGETQGR